MTDLEAIQAATEQYRKDGFTITSPSGAEHTTLLNIPEADLIASKGNEVVLVKLRYSDTQDVEPVIMTSGRREDDHSLTLLDEAEMLLMPETRRAALLLACLAFEAAAREVLQNDGLTLESQSSSAIVIQTLMDRYFLDAFDAENIQRATSVCGLVASGFQPTEISPDVIFILLELVKKLKYPRLIGTDRISRFGPPPVVRGVDQSSNLRQKVEMADALLNEVSGFKRIGVSTDWTVGEDGEGEQVIILRLSDFSGMVSGSFTLEEFDHPQRLKSRFYKIWGELLGFRIEEQLESLMGTRKGA